MKKLCLLATLAVLGVLAVPNARKAGSGQRSNLEPERHDY